MTNSKTYHFEGSRKNANKLCLMTIACLALSGCWYTQVTNGMVSTRVIEFDNSRKTYRIDRSHKVCAYDRTHIILMRPFGGASAEEALDKALDDMQGNQPVVGLSDSHVKWGWFFIPILTWVIGYGQTWYSVDGYPIYEIAKRTEAKAPVAIEKPTATSIKPVKQPKPAQKKSTDDFSDLPF